MTRLGADATAETIADLKALGATFIGRYVSDFPAKNLTLPEAQRLGAAQIDIVTNWENDVNDWQGGYARGVEYAKRALGQHAARGGPVGAGEDWGIYFSADMQIDPNDPRLHAYYDGTRSVLGVHHNGAYAQTSVLRKLRSLGLIGCGQRGGTWRSMSTFGLPEGLGNPGEFDIEQTGWFNAKYDRNVANSARFGQWRFGAPAPVIPPPAAIPEGPVYLVSVSPDPTQPGSKGTAGIFAVHEGLGPVHVDRATYTADFQKNHGPATAVSPTYYASLVAAASQQPVTVQLDAAAVAAELAKLVPTADQIAAALPAHLDVTVTAK